jgi:hypothetical protein
VFMDGKGYCDECYRQMVEPQKGAYDF